MHKPLRQLSIRQKSGNLGDAAGFLLPWQESRRIGRLAGAVTYKDETLAT